ncbi:hypothetical protein MATR_06300 [Marivirga tractuosa]|uniref:Phosphate/sulfate permease n=1 Tax=Marivirga tractuosa (strain ATCC 23168 / DSM 4126 / NBRC 15989 / NCIMB 1408 / VKM B-1430 / H-43) TaxID=643867 RepID=E4TRL6_MARTH|nr:hypothetical protein [Marivirga tractuosa]ADR21737.1 hypothetical protein Ftrac_1749 [Marivirga tractuosa DSM 4126]BDD13805.1 hypothetical protein MATR_06300 [Marivirga tractuosa]
MAKKPFLKYNRSTVSEVTYKTFEIAKKEKAFITMIAIFTFVCGLITPYPQIAMWVGFGLAAYSAIANDSIQTIGTFIASNSKKPWWILWLFMGLIFLATVGYSWVVFDGDVSSQRLLTKGFDKAPTSFSFLQLAAPILLLVLTRFRMPVSTTFLLLSAFSTQASSIGAMLGKSLTGYLLAFVTAIFVWFIVSKFVSKYFKSKKPAKFWTPVQWIISGALWSVWVSQDAANIAVFLPRSLNIYEFIGFAGFIFIGMGLLFFLKGDKIQSIVNEKAGVTDVRAATIVDFVYAILLYYFKVISTVPISTTWVFIGLLGGREVAIAISKKRYKKRIKNIRRASKIVGRDFLYATIGLVLSVLLAIGVNKKFQDQIVNEIMNFF